MVNHYTKTLPPTNSGVNQAVSLLKQGQLVAFPTETVYGLGADATNDAAVANIFSAKNRPQINPLIIHVANLSIAQKYVTFSNTAFRLAYAFWPGPVTLVLPSRLDSPLSSQVSAGLKTVAIRVPSNELAQQLLADFGGAVAAPSANLSGTISPTVASHVLSGLNNKIAAVLDGGACPVGLESTIIGFEPKAVLLRPGGMPVEIIEKCLGYPMGAYSATNRPSAPGQLLSHYAPNANLRLNAIDRVQGELTLGFGPGDYDLNLSLTGELTEAAANLFCYLRKLDSQKPDSIAVSPIPEHGLGRAINDRLKRAAAPRGQALPDVDDSNNGSTPSV